MIMEKTVGVDPIQKAQIYWEGLPFYAQLWIRHDYDKVQGIADQENFIRKYMEEYRTSNNKAKRSAIAMVIFPMKDVLDKTAVPIGEQSAQERSSVVKATNKTRESMR